MKILQASLIRLVVSFLPALLPIINAVAIFTPPNPSQTLTLRPDSFSDPALNGSSLGAIDPRSFRARMQYGSQALPATAVLMSAIDVMTQLALQDFQSDIEAKTYRMDDARYSQIEIYVGPSQPGPGATLKAGYAVLGLFDVVLNILTDPKNRFKSVQSAFLYEGREVGRFVMRRVPGAVSDPQSISTLPPSAAASLSDPALSAPAWSDPHLTLELTQSLDTLTIYELFLACAAVLRELAPQPRLRQVHEVTYAIDAPPITVAGRPIIVSFQNIGRTESRPPFFKWEWAIKAVGRLPSLMLEARNFKGVMEMILTVDRVHVGLGHFARQMVGTTTQ
ncbi:MAG: hypothetical protein LQ338_007481 [Usnochroma carphineum]|nr:MAG: hypothetical protein LQ338_007481 [Usnochroma carphineum]